MYNIYINVSIDISWYLYHKNIHPCLCRGSATSVPGTLAPWRIDERGSDAKCALGSRWVAVGRGGEYDFSRLSSIIFHHFPIIFHHFPSLSIISSITFHMFFQIPLPCHNTWSCLWFRASAGASAATTGHERRREPCAVGARRTQGTESNHLDTFGGFNMV